jgi:methionyl-tRNA formyltransferase
VALAHGIPLHQPERLKDPATHEPIRAACAAGAEVMVVAAYGLILPQAVLDLPRRGCINIHASLLPRWRGAAPIHRAIEAGDAQTGVTIMRMEAGLDTGPMLLAEAIDIEAQDTTGSLHDRLAVLGGRLIVDRPGRHRRAGAGATAGGRRNLCQQDRQDRGPTRLGAARHGAGAQAARLQSLPRRLRQHWPANRSSSGKATPWPDAGRPGHILAADGDGIVVACGEGALCLTELQKPGGRRLASADYLRGSPLKPD